MLSEHGYFEKLATEPGRPRYCYCTHSPRTCECLEGTSHPLSIQLELAGTLRSRSSARFRHALRIARTMLSGAHTPVSGGEDLFEFLDEAPPGDRGPSALIIPSAPVSPTHTPAVESREPSGYKTPLFFPFGKPEPTAPQLKLSGVSSLKKINR